MHSLPIRCAAATVLLLGVACKDGSGPDGDGGLEQALEWTATAEELSGVGLTMLGGVNAPTPSPTACPFNAVTQRFECAAVTRNGFTVVRHYQLLNAAGQVETAWSPAVATIRSISDVSGTVALGSGLGSIDMDSHEEMTLGGLQAATLTLTGTGTSNTATTTPAGTILSNGTRSTNLTLPRTAGAWPTGTITMTHTVTGTSQTSTMTMTCNGTPVVAMRMTMTGGVVVNCTFDMGNPQATPVCS